MYFLGAAPGVAEEAVRRLRLPFLGISVVGVPHGYLPQEQERRVLQNIREAAPDILVLGMGTPREEIWMTRHRDLLDVPVVWGAGGVFDYASERTPPPDRERPFRMAWACP
jgi:N-acetylglucosaminyldiphosphoundecaprenol N-acetyl-beta-D-mannosaminyltransferase